jgi:hypothetical protein
LHSVVLDLEASEGVAMYAELVCRVGQQYPVLAYALYSGDPSNGSSTTRVASFREGRIGYRLWATRTGRIDPSVEDRYDHDVDELMA